LANRPEFLRPQAVGEVEVTTGVALPVMTGPEPAAVAVLLSARHTPVARSFELWRPDEDNHSLRIANAYECTPDFQEALRKIRIRPGEGALGHAWVTGCPTLCEDLGRESSRYAHWACTEGLRSACAMPFSVDGRLSSIVVLAL
jgi:hypothetical protein